MPWKRLQINLHFLEIFNTTFILRKTVMERQLMKWKFHRFMQRLEMEALELQSEALME